MGLRRRGRKTSFRLWPEALAALTGMKHQFPKIERCRLNEQLISSAILFLAEQSNQGLDLIRSRGGLRPMSHAQAQAQGGRYPEYKLQPLKARPALQLV
jgi:hypothetical protein